MAVAVQVFGTVGTTNIRDRRALNVDRITPLAFRSGRTTWDDIDLIALNDLRATSEYKRIFIRVDDSSE